MTTTNPLEALLDAAVERAITRLLPHLVDPRPTWTTPKNVATLYGDKTWRAVDEWAQRRDVRRYSIAGSPAYKTADLDGAVEATTARGEEHEEHADDLLIAARKRAARK